MQLTKNRHNQGRQIHVYVLYQLAEMLSFSTSLPPVVSKKAYVLVTNFVFVYE